MATEAVTITRSDDLQPAISRFVELMNKPLNDVSGEYEVPSSQTQAHIPHLDAPVSRSERSINVTGESWMATMDTAPAIDDNSREMPSNAENELFGEFPMDSSPFFLDLSDQLGWDWAVFSHIFPEPETNCGDPTL